MSCSGVGSRTLPLRSGRKDHWAAIAQLLIDKCDEDFIAGSVPEFVVDTFEAIEIEHKQRCRLVRKASSRQFKAAFVSICAAYLFGGLVMDRIAATYQQAALTDPLTGVANRREFFQTGERLFGELPGAVRLAPRSPLPRRCWR